MKLSIENDVITLEPVFVDDLTVLKRLCQKEGDGVTLVRGPELSEDGKFVLASVQKPKATPQKTTLKERPKEK